MLVCVCWGRELGGGLLYTFFFYDVVSICLFFESHFLFIYLFLFMFIRWELARKQMSQIRNTRSACLFISTSSKTIDLVVVVVVCLSVCHESRRGKNNFKSYPFAPRLNYVRCNFASISQRIKIVEMLHDTLSKYDINIVTIVIDTSIVFFPALYRLPTAM